MSGGELVWVLFFGTLVCLVFKISGVYFSSSFRFERVELELWEFFLGIFLFLGRVGGE